MIEKRRLFLGMDLSSEQRYIQDGFSRKNLNVRVGSTDNQDAGSVENVKGNTLIVNNLPAGNNKTVGAYEWEQKSKIYFFVYNDQNNHSIYEYDEQTQTIDLVFQSPLLDFDPDILITGVNVVEFDDDNDLLYWVQRNGEPRKLNIRKAKVSMNPIRFSDNNFTLAGVSFLTTTPHGFVVGQKVQIAQDAGYTNASYEGEATVIAINSPTQFTIDKPFALSTPPEPGYVYDLTNGYTNPIKKEVFHAIKRPPLCPPTSTYADDPDQNVNYLENKIVQFKARFVYDDMEKSAWSAISKQTIPFTLCGDQIPVNTNNVIDITVPKGDELVRRVEIAARFDNVSDFISIVDKSIDDYTKDANGNYTYRFRNEKVYSIIDVTESAKLYDLVPLIAGAQEYIDGNRIVYGDIVEGYDNVDVDYDFEVSYNDVEIEKSLNTIKGTLRIINPFVNDVKYDRYQPVWLPKGESTPVFGGFDKNAVNDEAGSKYRQYLPLEGFVFYLAGTDYHGISKQRIGTDSNLQYGTGKYYTGSTLSDRNKIRNNIEGPGGGNSFGENTDTRVYSEFEINNVPDGTYILRIASHHTTSQDLLDPNRGYQKTSTNTVKVGGTLGFEKVITVSGGQVLELPNSEIMDLTDPTTLGISYALGGYVVDNDSASASIDDLLGQVRVNTAEVSLILWQKTAGGGISGLWNKYNTYGENAFLSIGSGLGSSQSIFNCRTDHNGYFFGALSLNVSPSPSYLALIADSGLKINTINVGGYPLNPNQYDLNGAYAPTTVYGTKEMSEGVYQSTNSDTKNYARTHVDLQFKTSTGIGVEDVVAVTTLGGWETSDLNGDVRLTTYSYQYAGNYIVDGDVYYYPSDINCDLTFNPILTTYSGMVNVNNYNNTNSIVMPTITTSSTLQQGISYLKRGGEYQHGIVYYDWANRSGSTNVKNKEDVLSIAFYTETVPVTTTVSIFGSSGVTGILQLIPYAGEPQVSWNIYNTPPEWATHYQWVRTKNLAINRYLQFAAKDVKYLNDAGGGSNYNNGTQIELDLTNITGEYKDKHPDSNKVYDYAVGDRIRFIRKADGTLFNEYYDFKITGENAGKITFDKPETMPEIFEGVSFEIYTPKLQEDNPFFYEIGECFEIGDPGLPTRYHKGPDQDQDPNDPINTPAKGVFTSGDAYYRYRNIPTLNGSQQIRVDDASYSDFFVSQVSDIGRPNIIDEDARQLRRPTTIYYSDKFVPETNINGLNSFFDISFETFDRKYGSIQKLFAQEKRLDCYQELKVGKILVNENVIYDQFDSGTIAASEKVLSGIIYYTGEYGIAKNPESFAEYGGRRYFFDVNRGAALRLSNDGLTVISDKLAEEYFENKSNFIKAFPDNPKIWGVYHRDFEEYVLSFGELTKQPTNTNIYQNINIADLIAQGSLVGGTSTYEFIIQDDQGAGVPLVIDVIKDITTGTYVLQAYPKDNPLLKQGLEVLPGETIAFNEKTKFWSTFYSYLPECMSACGLNIMTFDIGRAYVHNESSVYNNFYGVNYPSELYIPFNAEPSKVKVFNAIGLESGTVWEAPEVTTPNGQLSNLIEQDFQDDQGGGLVFDAKENIHYAHFWQDQNTPNVSDPLINGDDLRDTSLLVKLTKDSQVFEKLYAVNVNFSFSERSNK